MRPTVGNASTIEWRAVDDVSPWVTETTRAAFPVDDATIDRFQRDGVVYLPGAFSEWVTPLRAGLQRQLDGPDQFAFPCESAADGEPGRFFDSYCNWQRVPEYRDFVLTSGAAALAAACMGSPTAQLFHEHVFAKEAGTTKATPWHQDLPYYCVDGTQTASVYIALDDIPADTAVRFVAGTHRDGALYRPRNFLAGDEYVTGDATLGSLVGFEPDPSRLVSAALAPGDAIVFDFRTVHGSTAAPIHGRRRAFSTRWLGADGHYVTRSGETSPPIADHDMVDGDPLRTDWFPILWPNAGRNG